jgi:hypothetical protein
MFHAIMLVTREWCVEAETAEEAHGSGPRAPIVTWAIASTSERCGSLHPAHAPEHPDTRGRRAKLAAAGRVAGTSSRFLRGSAATGAAGGCFLVPLSSRTRAGIASGG